MDLCVKQAREQFNIYETIQSRSIKEPTIAIDPRTSDEFAISRVSQLFTACITTSSTRTH